MIKEEDFIRLMDEIPIPIHIWEKIQDHFVFTYYNKANDRLAGEKLESMLGKRAEDLYPANSEVIQQLKKSFEEKESFWHEMDYTFKSSGIKRKLLANYRFIPPNYILIYTKDITKQKKLEKKKRRLKEIRRDEQQYRSFIEKARNVILCISKDYKLIEFNPQAEKVYGYEKEEVIGKNYLDLFIPKEFHEAIKQDIDKVIAGEDTVGYENPIITKSGKKRDLLWNVTQLTNFKDQVQGIIAIGQDITEQKKAESKLRESEKMYQDAYQTSNFYKDLLIHDVNNIFQSINLSVQLLAMALERGEKIEKKAEETIDVVEEQIERGKILLQNVRKLNLIEESEKDLEDVDLCQVLSDSIKFIEKVFKNEEISIKLQEHDLDFRVTANQFLRDVFENLLINAIKYNNSELKKIWIEISRTKLDNKKVIRIEFKDNGIGIIDERKTIIFQRHSTSKQKGKGLGLGLSLVKKAIESYNGKIRVEDRVKENPSKGSNFILLIPESSSPS